MKKLCGGKDGYNITKCQKMVILIKIIQTICTVCIQLEILTDSLACNMHFWSFKIPCSNTVFDI